MEMEEFDWSSLTNDVFYEILSRTSLSSLYECRRVCRDWCRITYEPSFIFLHCRRTQTVSGYFIQRIQRNVYSSTFVPFSCRKSTSTQQQQTSIPISLDFLPRGTRILSVANRYGILCCQAPTNNHSVPRYIICKPTTLQWRSMPNPKTRYHTEKIAIFVEPPSSTDDTLLSPYFKIVRLSTNHRNLNNIVVEIFDSKTWRWRPGRINYQLPCLLFSSHDPGVEMRGVVHWLVPYDNAIFAFDVKREDWRLIPLPRWQHCQQEEEKYQMIKLVVGCEGRRLCLLRILKNKLDLADHELEIWGMVDYSKGRWEIIGRRELACLHGSLDAVEDLYTQEIAFLTSQWGATWYDMRSGEMTRVDDMNAAGISEHVFKYESDLQSCDLGYTPADHHVLEKKKKKKKKKKKIQQTLTQGRHQRQQNSIYMG